MYKVGTAKKTVGQHLETSLTTPATLVRSGFKIVLAPNASGKYMPFPRP